MIEIVKHNIPGVMLDNDMQMFNLLFKTVEGIDSNCRVSINKVTSTYKIMIRVSDIKYKKVLNDELRKLSISLGDIFEFPKTYYVLNHIYLSTK